MSNKKKFVLSKDDIAYEEGFDEAGFEDYKPPTGNCMSAFSFDNTDPIVETSMTNLLPVKSNHIELDNSTLTPSIDIFDNRTNPIANGAAPSINGETPILKRTYVLRPTTIKKLNELKAIHSDSNTYVSTIVDIAIDHYYNYIKQQNT